MGEEAEEREEAHKLMAIFGWLTLREAERYTQAARRRRMARAGWGISFAKRRTTNNNVPNLAGLISRGMSSRVPPASVLK